MTKTKMNKLQLELRGYEVAKLLEDGRWEQVSRWRPTDFALNEALHAAAWLNDRHPDRAYSVRPVVSMAAPEGPERGVVEDVLDGQMDLPFDVTDAGDE